MIQDPFPRLVDEYPRSLPLSDKPKFVVMAVFVVIGILAVIYMGSHRWTIYTYYNVAVLEKHDSLHWQMANESGVFEAVFCSDYVPQFEPGHILTWFSYEDRGSCWSVAAPELGYKLLRDRETGKALIWSNEFNSILKVINGKRSS